MSVLVLGIGNLIMGDDGVGVRAVQRLKESYDFPPGVEVIDGGTLGLDLLPRLEGVESLLVVDAVKTGGAAGDLIRLSGEEVPLAFDSRLSPHQVGLQDLLAVAALQGSVPGNIVLLGIEPADIGIGMELSPAVSARLDALVGKVVEELGQWGVDLSG